MKVDPELAAEAVADQPSKARLIWAALAILAAIALDVVIILAVFIAIGFLR